MPFGTKINSFQEHEIHPRKISWTCRLHHLYATHPPDSYFRYLYQNRCRHQIRLSADDSSTRSFVTSLIPPTFTLDVTKHQLNACNYILPTLVTTYDQHAVSTTDLRALTGGLTRREPTFFGSEPVSRWQPTTPHSFRTLVSPHLVGIRAIREDITKGATIREHTIKGAITKGAITKEAITREGSKASPFRQATDGIRRWDFKSLAISINQ